MSLNSGEDILKLLKERQQTALAQMKDTEPAVMVSEKNWKGVTRAIESLTESVTKATAILEVLATYNDIQKKIAEVKDEIEQIVTTKPYLYKLLFDDVEATGETRREYENEFETYTEYAAKLQVVLDGFRERGVLING